MYWKYVGVGIQFDAKNKYEKLKIYTEYMLQNVIKNETCRIIYIFHLLYNTNLKTVIDHYGDVG